MNQSVKAALLSALIFPGLGQMSLGHKKRGGLIIGFIAVLFFIIVNNIMKIAHEVINKMQQNGLAMDVETISKMTSEQVGFSDDLFLNIALILLIVTWLASILDAYLLGKK